MTDNELLDFLKSTAVTGPRSYCRQKPATILLWGTRSNHF